MVFGYVGIGRPRNGEMALYHQKICRPIADNRAIILHRWYRWRWLISTPRLPPRDGDDRIYGDIAHTSMAVKSIIFWLCASFRRIIDKLHMASWNHRRWWADWRNLKGVAIFYRRWNEPANADGYCIRQATLIIFALIILLSALLHQSVWRFDKISCFAPSSWRHDALARYRPGAIPGRRRKQAYFHCSRRPRQRSPPLSIEAWKWPSGGVCWDGHVVRPLLELLWWLYVYG